MVDFLNKTIVLVWNFQIRKYVLFYSQFGHFFSTCQKRQSSHSRTQMKKVRSFDDQGILKNLETTFNFMVFGENYQTRIHNLLILGHLILTFLKNEGKSPNCDDFCTINLY
jgi:hypothetical protein